MFLYSESDVIEYNMRISRFRSVFFYDWGTQYRRHRETIAVANAMRLNVNLQPARIYISLSATAAVRYFQ